MAKSNRIPGSRRGGVLFVLPEIRDDLPVAVKNALALRNACTVNGRCPSCGAVASRFRVEHGIHHATFEHEDWCRALVDGEAGQA